MEPNPPGHISPPDSVEYMNFVRQSYLNGRRELIEREQSSFGLHAVPSAHLSPMPLFDTRDLSAVLSAPPPPPVCQDASNTKQRIQVDHSYTDYSLVADDDLEMLERSGPLPETGSEQEKMAREKIKDMASRFGPAKNFDAIGGTRIPFTAKLMQVLDRGDMDDVIRWMPHGRAFRVMNQKACVDVVLPRFFKQSKWTSFIRQLNLWGFKRLTHGPDAGAYYHECFLRGRRNLCMRIRRQKNKGTGIKPWPNPQCEPQLYKLPPMPELDQDRPVSPLPPLSSNVPTDTGTNFAQTKDVEVSSSAFVSTKSTRIPTSDGLLNVQKPQVEGGIPGIHVAPCTSLMEKAAAFGGTLSNPDNVGEKLINLNEFSFSSFLGFQPGELSDASVANDQDIDLDNLVNLKESDDLSSFLSFDLDEPTVSNSKEYDSSIDWNAAAELLSSDSKSNTQNQKIAWSTPSPVPDDDLFTNGCFDWDTPDTLKEITGGVKSDRQTDFAFPIQAPPEQMQTNPQSTISNGTFGLAFLGGDSSIHTRKMHQLQSQNLFSMNQDLVNGTVSSVNANCMHQLQSHNLFGMFPLNNAGLYGQGSLWQSEALNSSNDDQKLASFGNPFCRSVP